MKIQNRLFYVLLLSLFSFFFWGCTDPSEKEDSFFDIKEEALKVDFKETQGSQIIPIRTNLDSEDWKVSSNQAWCLVTKESSGIKIVVLPSEEVDVRTATVLVQTPIKEYAIQVRQLGYGPAILIKESVVAIEAVGGDFAIEITSNIEYNLTRSAQSDWIVDKPASRGFVTKGYHYSASSNLSFESRTALFTYVGKENPEISATCTITQNGKKINLSDVVIEGDIQIMPIGGKDNQHHLGNDITKSFDGKRGTGTVPYHSPWSTDNPTTQFPVILEYFFDGTKDLDYLIYHTRSGNGNFGKFDLYLSTESTPEYTFCQSFDFMERNSSSRIDFRQRIEKVKGVKFVVKSGLGGFASCDEMEFFQINQSTVLDRKLLTVFQDVTCTALKVGVTSEQINALPSYFAHIAIQLKNETYNPWEKEFRICSYKPYSNEVEWSDKLMTKKYSNLDNPTGIYVEKGDTVIVLVGETHGQRIKINCIGEETTNFNGSTPYVQTEASATGEEYDLKEGVNKIGFHKTGMLFIMYNTDLSLSTALPIKIHIPLGSGKVSGFFDLKEHKTNDKYKELIDRATYKYFCVRGDKIIFYFHRDKMKEAVPYDMLSAINLWDDIVGWQQELMGIENVRPHLFNNHLFAMSPEGSYMWANNYRIGFVYTYLRNILLKENVMAVKDNAWGPAHEIGHIHQKAINWPGSSESSNNLFSNYILYKLGKYCSRGSELKALADARFVNKAAWCNMLTPATQKENTELHMRMNWQLWNYYHRCGYKINFWQTLFKLLRENRIEESDPGAGQLLFAKMASKAANEDLTDFFEMWGFFVPVDKTIEQYGTFRYLVTDQMINEAKNYMAQFPKAKHAFYYLEDRQRGDVGLNTTPPDAGYYLQFKNNQRITKTVNYSQSGQHIIVQNGDEAVAFEIKRGDRLVYFANMYSFDVPESIDLATIQFYAVQADGTRVLMHKK